MHVPTINHFYIMINILLIQLITFIFIIIYVICEF